MRAIADKREGVVRLLAQEESQAAAVASAEEELRRIEEALAEARSRARGADGEVAEVVDKLAAIEAERSPLDDAHVRAHTESDAAEKRLEQLRAAQRERERAVASLESRIATLREQAPKVHAADVLMAFEPLAGLVAAEPGLDTALAAALGPHAEALAGRVTEDVLHTMADAQRSVVVDARGGSGWRMDTDLSLIHI